MNKKLFGQARHWLERTGLLILVLVVLMLFANQNSIAHAQAGTTVTISPAVHNVALNSTVTFDVLINDYNDNNPPGQNPNGLYGADVRLSFNPLIAQAQDSIPVFVSGINMFPGPLLTSGDFSTLFNTADNSAGTARFVVTQLNPTPPQTCPTPPDPCSGVVVSITFKGIAVGSTPISITFQELGNANGLALPATVVHGVLNVFVPTAEGVTNFRGAAAKAGKVRLDWDTSSELDLVGFNVWRGESLDGEFSKRNAKLIPVKNPGSLQGNTYSYSDNKLQAGTEYWFKLEAVKPNGDVEWFGPITVNLTKDCAFKPNKTKLLSPTQGETITTNVALDWSDVVCAKKYRLQIRRGSSEGFQLHNRFMTASEWSGSLSAGETYYWRIRTLAGKRHSVWTDWRAFTVK